MQNFQILCRIWKHVNRSVVELCAVPSPPNAAADNSSARAADVLSVTNYRAMLCIRGTVSVCLSVRPSVTSRSSTKTAKRKMTNKNTR